MSADTRKWIRKLRPVRAQATAAAVEAARRGKPAVPNVGAERRSKHSGAESPSIHDEIEQAVAAMSAFQFQDLVAALLRGMGYYTPVIAKPGPDGGTDVLAYRDPLGAHPPHIRVQVKHRGSKATRAEIAALKGIIHRNRDIGIFVSSGGFSPEAEREAKSSDIHVEVIGLERFISLWMENYEKLPEEDRARLRLKKVYLLAQEKESPV